MAEGGLLSFLFEGNPPPQTTSYTSTSSNLPDWFAAYAQGLLNKTSAVAGEPYRPFTGPRVAGFAPEQESAFAAVRAAKGLAQPSVTAGGALTTAGGNTSSLTAAQPYLTAANTTFPRNVDAYMNPYISRVTDRIAELGNRNLLEKVLPGVQDQFIAAGQPGSARGAEFTSRAMRDTAGEIAGAQAGALATGYNQAGQLFQADRDAQAKLGQLTGQLASDTAGRQVTAGRQLGDLGALGQQVNLRDAAALEAAGTSQRALTQQNLDEAFRAFSEERDYPRTNVALLNQALRGVNPPTSTTATTTGPATAMSSSPLAQLAGAGLTAAALGNVFGAPRAARGGRVRVYRRGGPVRGALSYGP